jgi:hypothetical protein
MVNWHRVVMVAERRKSASQPSPLPHPPLLFANENVIEMKDEVCFAYTGPGFKQGVTRI